MVPNLQPEEKDLLMFLLSQQENLSQYVAFPSFQAEQQQLFSARFSAALPSLKDALLACAITLKQSRTAMVTDTTFSVQYILKAMDVLRSLPVLSSQDAVLCNALGGLLAFSISSAIGVGVPDICRHCLGTTTSFVETAVSDASNDPWKSFLVLLETLDCFVYRQKPILRIQVLSSAVVDCRLGLCLPLLPYYHDLCVISNSLINITDMDVIARLQKQLDDTHCIVEPWQPSQLNQLVEQFDSTEIVHLLAQARVYRLGALLLGHRLRFPFGQEDSQAEIWSKEIIMELELAKGVTKRSMRFVTLPFIIASVEARDKNLRFRILELVDDCVDHYAQFLQKATKIFLSRIWQERDLNLTTRWFDSVHKPCPVLNSINATCFIG
ncbi:03d7b62e-533d-4aa1-a476-e626818fa7df-CDS [Sclerotinia trifoliorum]|uniref:03d7b62e-533d-4aa1-a476-e626818fa7df-CDS n=1 Tax=Sclerotinia trifoliorum TaxID=28548 RepID=A0A8H2ZMV0_9HELO|nr:03d7b62e-533d-4aa1-a476-e626818fa7df-CDS [Sclerotinia trifoliorum]